MNAYGKLYKTEINISIIIFGICFFSSCNRIPKGYKSYQTFDEYLMKGVNDTNYADPHVAIKAVKDYLPEKSGRVRIPSLKGSWQLIPIAKNVTKIVYQVHCDIGGLVPAVIINAYITETPFSNLSSIKRIVESPLYPRTVRADVKEL